MIYSTVAFTWVSGTVVAAAVNTSTTDVVNGACLSRVFWRSPAARVAYVIWYHLSFYVAILSIFVLCYWRILAVIRRQAKTMAAHDATGPSTAQAQLKRSQANITKTMLLVSVLFAITMAPGSWATGWLWILAREVGPDFVRVVVTWRSRPTTCGVVQSQQTGRWCGIHCPHSAEETAVQWLNKRLTYDE